MQTLGNFISRLYYFSYSPRFLSTFKSLLSDLKKLQFCSLCILYACFMHACFMHSFCVVIILFHTDLCKSAFSTYSFKKRVFGLCVLWVFCLFFDFIFRDLLHLYNYCFYKYQVFCDFDLTKELSNNASFFFSLYINYL